MLPIVLSDLKMNTTTTTLKAAPARHIDAEAKRV
jgi:hypothetical protein